MSDAVPIATTTWTWPTGGEVIVGSEAHRELFCRFLLDSSARYRADEIRWPELDDAARARLAGLPFWDIAVETERRTAHQMACCAEATSDPLIREAVALNAFEEDRHQAIIRALLAAYGIPEPEAVPLQHPADPERAFMSTGYAECFDSFFAFGLFRLAERSGFFPPPLIAIFDPIMQEEARHIVFFANWVAYHQARRPGFGQLAWAASRLGALGSRAWNRVALARRAGNNSNMTIGGKDAVTAEVPSLRGFLELCQAEDRRRLGGYDPRLLRPRAMPRIARTLQPLLGRA